jgi:EpsI family protein
LLSPIEKLSGRPVHLYVAYFASQRQGKEIANYQTGRLHQFAEKRTIQVGPKETGWINSGHFTDQAGVRYPILFWYEVNGRIVAGPSRARWSAIENALLRGRTNGTFVLVYGEGERNDRAKQMEEGEVFQEGDSFIQDLLPLLGRYFQPSEK